jgi:hypothetical protein
MEKIVNCEIIIDIELIENISGGNQYFEIEFVTKEKDRYKLSFDFVWDMRYSIENGYIDKFYKFERSNEVESSIYIVENSDYVKYFENQSSGTLPMKDVKNYILSDKVDTVVEILTIKEPLLEKIK